ncbi:hypothetical protein OAD66_04160 [Bacteroidia bacterium]|nr:hypothetical protein [Bacteroidia bacterium]
MVRLKTMKINFLITLLLVAGLTTAQTAPFSISIESVAIESLAGLQSYTWGQHDGKWLISRWQNGWSSSEATFCSL